MTSSERILEGELISKLQELKYSYREDIRDRATLEANFREKFQQLNRVKLTDEEFARLLEEIVTPDVFTAAQTLRTRNSFTREDGTPLNYTLVTGPRKKLESVFDFACGSGSLLLNVRHRVKEAGGTIGKIYRQEYNVTTYNLARMNMLLHGVKDTEFEIYHGDTLTNAWDFLRETNPAKKPQFDAVVANPPFSYRWEPTDTISEDMRFKSHGMAPKSAADLAFLLHGLHYVKDDGVMAIILPHGVLFRGGVEERIRRKLLDDGHIDTVIGLPANLFYSTGIPVCILVLKKCKRPDDVLFINAAEHFVKGKRQNQLTDQHIEDIVSTYQHRRERDRYARCVSMKEITDNDYNLNISRYVSTALEEAEVDLAATHAELVRIEGEIAKATAKHNEFLKELGLPLLPSVSLDAS